MWRRWESVCATSHLICFKLIRNLEWKSCCRLSFIIIIHLHRCVINVSWCKNESQLRHQGVFIPVSVIQSKKEEIYCRFAFEWLCVAILQKNVHSLIELLYWNLCTYIYIHMNVRRREVQQFHTNDIWVCVDVPICAFIRFVFNERYNQIDAGTSGHT